MLGSRPFLVMLPQNTHSFSGAICSPAHSISGVRDRFTADTYTLDILSEMILFYRTLHV